MDKINTYEHHQLVVCLMSGDVGGAYADAEAGGGASVRSVDAAAVACPSGRTAATTGRLRLLRLKNIFYVSNSSCSRRGTNHEPRKDRSLGHRPFVQI